MSEPMVHGLADELVAPDWAPPTTPELEAVLACFGLGAAADPSWVSPRPLSSAVLLQLPDGEILVKRHDLRVRTVAQLAEEHAFASHLRQRGILTPDVLPAPDGSTAVELAGWSYELQHAAAGSDRYRDAMSWTPFVDVDDARAAGSLLGRLHTSAADYTAAPRTTTVLTSRVEVLEAGDLEVIRERALAAHPHLDRALDRPKPALAAYIAAQLEHVASSLPRLERRWGHNDWHASNLFWDPAGGSTITSVIDFGLADLTYPVVDLAIALERNAFRWLELPNEDIAVTDQALALLGGYQSVRPLEAAERELLPELLPVVHLDFALSEVDYFGGVLADAERAGIAWHGYALGHASWFLSPVGQEFDRALRAALKRSD